MKILLLSSFFIFSSFSFAASNIITFTGKIITQDCTKQKQKNCTYISRTIKKETFKKNGIKTFITKTTITITYV